MEPPTRMNVPRSVLALAAIAAACRPASPPATSVAPLAARGCPSPADLRAAFVADSLKRSPDDLPPHAYVTYLLDGQVMAANLRQDSLSWYRVHAAGLEVFDTIAKTAVRDIKAYRPNEAPSQLNVCPGVLAVDVRTRADP